VRATALRITSPAGEVSTAELDGSLVTIGRPAPEHAPDISLGPDHQRWVSRVHCTLDSRDGVWMVADNASTNGTLLRKGDDTRHLDAPRRIQHGDMILILGEMSADAEPLYWELTFLDPHTTRRAPHGVPAPGPAAGLSLRYDWVAAIAYRCEAGAETPITGLRPQGHQLLRYMTGRSQAGGAVACDHRELITALWGEPEEWRQHRSYTRSDLATVVLATRRSIEPVPSTPRILETVTGIGYRLHVFPQGPAP